MDKKMTVLVIALAAVLVLLLVGLPALPAQHGMLALLCIK